jgi:CRISPR-associated protein Csm4
MDLLSLRIVPRGAFGTPIVGDTLLGHLCWAVRHRYGEGRLEDLLAGYTSGRPFAVVSDAFPAGHLPRPALPASRLGAVDPLQRKEAKRRRWLPAAALAQPARWLEEAVELPGAEVHPQAHNAINRATGTTGRGRFAPYTMSQRWYRDGTVLDCYVRFDPGRVTAAELGELFVDIGASGYGRDASTGLGRFDVDARGHPLPPTPADARAWLTLAPCSPDPGRYDPALSFYHVLTRFGRHGALAVHSGNPFKTPVLLAQTGAVLTPLRFETAEYVGRGLGGETSLSLRVRGTVHQGYAPVVAIPLPPPEDAP